jgi:methyl-accepting chemotaxis protein
MDQMTQQNAAMVEESTAASHSLAQEAGKLASLIGQFTMSEVPTAAVSRPASRPKAAAGRQRPVRAASRPISRGNTALALAVEPAAEESWEEF